jgi:hypothetical protein
MPCIFNRVDIHGHPFIKITTDNPLLPRHTTMPDIETFADIRFHVHNGDRLATAYEKEGLTLDIPDYLVPAIKEIYLMNVPDSSTDKPVGDWIYEEACKVLQMLQPDNRMIIQAGWTVPNPTEQKSIKAKLATGLTLLQSYDSVCPDIIPPPSTHDFITKAINYTSAPFYNILKAAIVWNQTIPDPTQDIPIDTDDSGVITETPTNKKSYTAIILIAILVTYFIIKNK